MTHGMFAYIYTNMQLNAAIRYGPYGIYRYYNIPLKFANSLKPLKFASRDTTQ